MTDSMTREDLTGQTEDMHPMLALLMLIVSMSWTFGLTAVGIGHLNQIAHPLHVLLRFLPRRLR